MKPATNEAKCSCESRHLENVKRFTRGAFDWLTLALCQASLITGVGMASLFMTHRWARLTLLLGIIAALTAVICFRRHRWLYYASALPAFYVAGTFLLVAISGPLNLLGAMVLLSLLFVMSMALGMAGVASAIMLLADQVPAPSLRVANRIGGACLSLVVISGLAALRPTEGKLVHAVTRGNTTCARMLLLCGVNPNSYSMWYPWGGAAERLNTVLAIAARRGDDAMVDLLLKYGADGQPYTLWRFRTALPGCLFGKGFHREAPPWRRR